MRVTSAEMSRNFLYDLETLNSNYNRASQQVSSGKKLTQLSDSPSGSSELVSLTGQAADIDTYRSNMNTSTYFLKIADSNLSEVNNIFTTIYTRGSEAGTETISDEGRAAIATEIRTLRDQIFALANSQVRDRYIFGGSHTLEAPFEITGDTVTYVGNDDVNSVVVNNGVEVKVSVSGDGTFNSIFTAIESLLTALDSNDINGIQSALDQFPTAFADLGQARGQIGSNLSLLESISGVLDSSEFNMVERRSNIEDADLADVAVQLKQTQTALEAAMSAGGSVLTKPNLFDILG